MRELERQGLRADHALPAAEPSVPRDRGLRRPRDGPAVAAPRAALAALASYLLIGEACSPLAVVSAHGGSSSPLSSWCWRPAVRTSTPISRSFPTVELGEPAFYPTLQAYGGAPIVGGNDVQILLNGEEIFPALVEAIRAARTSITYAQYFVEEGPVVDDVVEALAERCRAGRAGARPPGRRRHAQHAGPLHRHAARQAGCQVKTFRAARPWALRRANNRNHRRILVVDGRVGFTGGSGVSRKWMGNGRTAGPLARHRRAGRGARRRVDAGGVRRELDGVGR